MADKEYVIRLTVDAAGASTELSNFTAKADGAAAPMRRIAKAYEEVQAKTDPVFRALLIQQREVEKATLAGAQAVAKFGVSQDAVNKQIQKTSEYYGQQVTKAREAADATGKVAQAASQADPIYTRLQGTLRNLVTQLGAVVVASFGINAIISSVTGAVNRLEETERVANRLGAVLASTGNAAGTSVDEVKEFADEIQRTTGTAAEEVVAAAARLATFETITGEAFRKAIKTAVDFSEVYGGNLASNIEAVARALEDPIKGMAMLQKQGFNLSDEQKKLVEQMVRVGDVAGWQSIIFQQVAGTTGAAEKAYTGLRKAMGDTRDAADKFFEALVGGTASGVMTTAITGLTTVLRGLTERMDAIATAAGIAGTAMLVAFGPAILAVVGTLATSVWALNAALMANPIARVAAATAAALTILVAYSDKTLQLGGITVNVGAILDAIWVTIKESIKGTFGWLFKLSEAMGRFLTMDFSGAKKAFLEAGQESLKSGQAIAEAWKKVGDGINRSQQEIDGSMDTGAFAGMAKPPKVAGREVGNAAKLNDYEKLTKATEKQISALKAEAQTYGMSMAAAAAFRKEQELLTAAELSKIPITEAMRQQIKLLAEAYGTAKSEAEQLGLQRKADFDLATVGLSGVESQIAAVQYQLHGDGWQAFMNDGLAATMRLTDQMKELKSATDSFGQSLLSGIMSGKGIKESLLGAGSQMTGQLAQSGLKNLMAGGSGGKASNLGTMGGVVGVASAGLAGYESADPLGGAVGGALAGFSVGGPVGAVIGGAVGLIGGLLGQSNKKKKEAEAAKKAWEDLSVEVNKFTDQLMGKNNGTLGGAIADATEKAQKYADVAHKAGQSSRALNDALVVYIQKITTDFISAFDVTVESLYQGLGNNSPAISAQQNIKKTGDALKGFIEDATKAGHGLSSASPAIAAATDSAQKYALSLLQTAPVVSEVQAAILTLRGGADQLQQTLKDLGMSAGATATAISAGITAQMNNLRKSFTEGQQAIINNASGNEHINQMRALMASSGASLNDAELLGVDPKLVAQAFQLQAQNIIDSAGLTGSAFEEFIDTFPEFAGVLGQSKTAFDEFTKNIRDFLDGLKTGSLSTLSPADKLAAAKSIYESQLEAAKSGDTVAMGALTGSASVLLTIAKDYFASSPDYAAVFDKISSDLSLLPDFISDSENGIGGTDNTAKTLAAMEGMKETAKALSVNMVETMTRLKDQQNNIAGAQSSYYFGPMRDYLAQIAANTSLGGNPFHDTMFSPVGTTWQEVYKKEMGIAPTSDVTAALANGGIVGAYAGGGMVGNGIWNRDSVIASYAGGGNIALAGGEGVINAARTAQMGGRAWVDAINSGRSGSNDNDAVAAGLDRVAKTVAAVAMEQISTLKSEIGSLRAEVRRLNDTTRIESNRPARAGTKAA